MRGGRKKVGFTSFAIKGRRSGNDLRWASDEEGRGETLLEEENIVYFMGKFVRRRTLLKDRCVNRRVLFKNKTVASRGNLYD